MKNIVKLVVTNEDKTTKKFIIKFIQNQFFY